MTRVLHVAQPGYAGVGVVVRDLVRDQVTRGWQVTVATPPGPLARFLRDSGATHALWPATRSPGPSTLDESRRLARIVRATRPDVVHLHSSKAGLAGRLALRGGLPTVFQPHAWSFLAADGAMGKAAARWERFATRWTDAVVHVSAGEREQGEAVGIHAHWELVPNGIDLAHFSPRDRGAARSRLGLGAGPLAVCPGRICHQKAQDLLLDVWPTVTAAVAGAELVLVGRLEMALPARLPPGVTVAAEVDDLLDWYAAADVVATPSRYEAGLPLVAREAMACGRPVIVTDLPEVRDDAVAEAGAVVAVDDGDALTRELVCLLTDDERARRQGAAGRAAAEQRFDIARTADGVAGVYARVLSGRRT
jgi:glycosyltransferase involved in cell wall biosynthesis